MVIRLSGMGKWNILVMHTSTAKDPFPTAVAWFHD